MKHLRTSLFAVCMLFALAGCGRAVQAKAAPGFVELKDDPLYDFRAVAPDGVAVAARVVKLEDAQDVSFWERAVALRMREMEGYALVESKDVKTLDGVAGRELVFGHDEQGKPFIYRIRLFAKEKKLLVLEAGGTAEQMQRFASSVDWQLAQFKAP
jgi:hypothetical protein